MGLYINPKDMEKEDWLRRNNTGVMTSPPARNTRERNGERDMIVCLVDNGVFLAAGVAYSQDELCAFAIPDGRDKLFIWVPIMKLEEVLGQSLESFA